MLNGTRLACTMVASPGEVHIAPVIDIAALRWIDSRCFMSRQGPTSVEPWSVLHNILGRNQRSAAYVILGTATMLYNLQALFICMLDATFVNCLNTVVHLIAFSQTFLCWALQVSFELSIMPSSFVCRLACIWCVSWLMVVGWVRTRVLALFAFSCEWVKLTNANLFISRGELNVRDHSNTPFLRSIMSFSVLCASSKFLPLASRVVSSTKPTIRSFGSSFVATRMRGALYIA